MVKKLVAAAVLLFALEAVKPGFDQGVEGGALGSGKGFVVDVGLVVV